MKDLFSCPKQNYPSSSVKLNSLKFFDVYRILDQ